MGDFVKTFLHSGRWVARANEQEVNDEFFEESQIGGRVG